MSDVLTRVEYSTDSGGPGDIPPGYPAGTIHAAQAPLGAGQTWTSSNPHVPGRSFQRLRVLAASDVAGTMKIQQSWNQNVWFTTATGTVAADYTSGTVIEALACAKYMRVVYVNGAAPQTHFTLITGEVLGAAA